MSDVIAAVSVAMPLFAIGVASPGPATLAIMNLSMRSGRAQGLSFATGICSGSLFWGLLASWGLSAVLASQAALLAMLKIGGALYFLWLAHKSLRSAWLGAPLQPKALSSHRHAAGYYVAGLALHLLNPKAMFVWMAVIGIALSKMMNPNPVSACGVTLLCWLLSVAVFVGYALAFSTGRAVAVYRRLARWIDGVCGSAFVVASVVILWSL